MKRDAVEASVGRTNYDWQETCWVRVRCMPLLDVRRSEPQFIEHLDQCMLRLGQLKIRQCPPAHPTINYGKSLNERV